MKLNLGACDRRIDGFVSVDIAEPADQIADLAALWPWPDASVDEVRAHDVIEHIGDCDHTGTVCSRCFNRDSSAFRTLLSFAPQRHPLGRIHFMNELHRVLKPGARATIETPNASRGAGFFQDPTHKSPWCLNSFQYFEAGSFAHNRLAKTYGITAAFRVVSLGESSYQDVHEQVWKITAILEAVK